MYQTARKSADIMNVKNVATVFSVYADDEEDSMPGL